MTDTTHVNANPAHFAAQLATLPTEGPIVMLNLLRFAERATYPADHPDHGSDRSGREAYDHYKALMLPYMAEHVGAKTLVYTHALATLIGPADETWDEVLVVEYPSLETFTRMVGDPAYHRIGVHRTAALADARLVAMKRP